MFDFQWFAQLFSCENFFYGVLIFLIVINSLMR